MTARWIAALGLLGCTPPPSTKARGDTAPPSAETGAPSVDTGPVAHPSELAPGIHRLDGLELDRPPTDLAALATLVGDAQVVALGESIHFSGGYHAARARMIPYLVETLGVRVVAFEGPWGAAEGSRPYVERCEGGLRPAMAGLYFSVWQSPETAHTLEWLCGWNADHPDDPVHFFGFDVQEPWHDGPFLRRLLAAAAPEPEALLAGLEPCLGGATDTTAAFWDTPDGEAIAAGSYPLPGLSERTEACRAGLDAVSGWLDGHEAAVVAARSADDLTLARVALVALQAAHLQFSSPTWDVAGWDARDEGMADVFELLWRQRTGAARAVIWAHNAHIIERGEALEGSVYPAGWVDMGSHLGRRLGDDYAAIGFVASEVAWSWPGAEGSASAADGTLEHLLAGLGEEALLIDLPVATADGTVVPAATAFPAGHPAEATFVPADHYRGLLYLESSAAMAFWSPE